MFTAPNTAPITAGFIFITYGIFPFLLAAYNDQQMTLEWKNMSGAKATPGLVFTKMLSEMGGIFKVEKFTQGKMKRTFGTEGIILQLLSLSY